MTTRVFAGLILGIAALSAGAQTRNRNFNISTQGNAETCPDLKVTSSAELVRSADTFSMQRGEVPTLELNATERGILKVEGWTQSGYSLEACKIAVAADRATAERALSGISVTRSAGHFTMNGPTGDDASWQVYFIVHVPANASLDLQATNGPISVANVTGNIKVRATNGPLSISHSSGTIDAQTENGPISFSGDSGEVHLAAHNGPLSVKLSKDIWSGSLLDAKTVNGPVSLVLPAGFHSGVRVEAAGHAPMSCRHELCGAAFRDKSAGKQTLQFNGSSETVRVSTTNGPISVSGDKKAL